MTSVLDDKRRVVLPKEIVEDLGLEEGTAVTFEKRKGIVVLKRARREVDLLREAMAWDPPRVRKLHPISEKEMKAIWG